LVIDTLLPADDQPHEYQILWHLNTDSAAISPDNPLAVASVDNAQPNLAIITSALPGLAVQVVSAQETPEWQGWKSYANVQGSYLPAPTAVYHWSASGAQQLVTLLYPLPAGAVCPVTNLAADEQYVRLVLWNGGEIALNLGDFA